MSLFTFATGRESPLGVQLTDTSYTTIVTAGNNGGTVLGLRVSEVAGSTPTLILDIADRSGAVVAQICNLRPFTAREIWEPVKLDGIPIVLLAGWSLRAKASAGNQLHATGVYIDPPHRS